MIDTLLKIVLIALAVMFVLVSGVMAYVVILTIIDERKKKK